MCILSSGDGEVVEQVISQQTAEHEAAAVRRSGSILDEAIRQLQEQQDLQSQTGPEAAQGAGADLPGVGQAEKQSSRPPASPQSSSVLSCRLNTTR